MIPRSLVIIAGKGSYPLMLAESAREQGVGRLCAVAFEGETDRSIVGLVDDVKWMRVGELQAFLDAHREYGIADAVMAGQITPSNLFKVRMDGAMRSLIGGLSKRNADSIFGAICDALKEQGVSLHPAHRFMEKHLSEVGVLTQRSPNDTEREDLIYGLEIAHVSSAHAIGQTVVVKEGTVLAVEAFEGTDAAILRGGKLSEGGGVVSKVAQQDHDMRWDIPVIGERTLKSMKKAGVTALGVEEGKAILLDLELLATLANKWNIAIEVFPVGGEDRG